MSAFVCKRSMVAGIARWAAASRVQMGYRLNHEDGIYGEYRETYKKLMHQNVLSVCYRYSEDPDLYRESLVAPEYEEAPDPAGYSVVQLLKAVDCLEYQSCETPGYYTSDDYRQLDGIRRRMVAALPGYEDAEWGL